MNAPLELVGKRFGRLTVLSRAGSRRKGSLWRCQCDCGVIVEAVAYYLTGGDTTSCGCARADSAREVGASNRTHGHRSTRASRTYASWRSMRHRCLNPRSIDFPHYGGSGICVSERWSSFENFLADMGERPPGMSLDRYPNPAGNYEPDNCRWATPKQQRANQRKSVTPKTGCIGTTGAAEVAP